MLVEALVAELAIESLDVADLHRPAWLDQDVADAACLCPRHGGSACELRAIVGTHGQRLVAKACCLVQHAGDVLARDLQVDADLHALVAEVIFVYNAGFEMARIRDLAQRFPRLSDALLALNERVVDLLPVARDHYYHPSQQGSWSIKAVLPALCPDLNYGDLDGVQDGDMAMEVFMEAISPQTSAARKAVSMHQLFIIAAMAVFNVAAHAQGMLLKVPTRPDVVATLFWEPAPNAKATVFLFPGGAGGFGKVENGKATGGNFLVRSAPYFLANGFNVAIFGRPNGMELGWTERTEPAHMSDVQSVLDFVKQKSDLPVWIVGTSRGTVSATAMAIHIQDPAIAGLVLTSSVVRYGTPGAVPRQNLQAIKVPVLVYHHAKDGCKHCQASDAPAVIKGLTQAPIKKLMVVDGGASPTGDVCAGQHWHGFIGMEKEAVDTISKWINSPLN